MNQPPSPLMPEQDAEMSAQKAFATFIERFEARWGTGPVEAERVKGLWIAVMAESLATYAAAQRQEVETALRETVAQVLNLENNYQGIQQAKAGLFDEWQTMRAQLTASEAAREQAKLAIQYALDKMAPHADQEWVNNVAGELLRTLTPGAAAPGA